MLLILEIVMLPGGIWAIISGKVPTFLVGGGKYHAEGLVARLIGVLFVLPLPIVFVGAFALGFLFGEGSKEYAILFEIVVVAGTALLAAILIRVGGRRVEYASDVEATIAKKARGAFMYAVFSVTGVGAVICCPLAFMYATQALRLIDEHGVGEQHRRRANFARIVAGVFALLWGTGAVLCVVLMTLTS
jgi:hypothetical protein